jgi:DnaJ-class molecular chaperone
MKCEFCQGTGQADNTLYLSVWPCPECQGTGIADCCNGMTADQVCDQEASVKWALENDDG